jgi:hypothetical protein
MREDGVILILSSVKPTLIPSNPGISDVVADAMEGSRLIHELTHANQMGNASKIPS